MCAQDELHEYLGLMQALQTAFADRNNALLTVQTLMSDVAASNLRIDKLVASSNKVFGGSKTQNRKVEELKDAVKVTEEARDLALNEYEQIKVQKTITYQDLKSSLVGSIYVANSCLVTFLIRHLCLSDMYFDMVPRTDTK